MQALVLVWTVAQVCCCGMLEATSDIEFTSIVNQAVSENECSNGVPQTDLSLIQLKVEAVVESKLSVNKSDRQTNDTKAPVRLAAAPVASGISLVKGTEKVKGTEQSIAIQNDEESEEHPKGAKQVQSAAPSPSTVCPFCGMKSDQVLCSLKSVVEQNEEIHRVRQSQEPLPKVHGKCAVVSSSGVMTMHSHGQSIDEKDYVVRFNQAPTEGFEKYVGSKEGLRIVNEKVVHEFVGDDWTINVQKCAECKDMEADSDYIITCSVCGVGKQERMDEDDFLKLQHAAANKDPSLRLYSSDLTLERAFFNFLHDEYGVSLASDAGPTTGAIGMLTALNMCDQVYAYGMGDTDNAMYAAYHYYDKKSIQGVSQTRNWHRSFDAEKDIWRRLAVNNASNIEETDVLVIPGFSRYSNCSAVLYGASSHNCLPCQHLTLLVAAVGLISAWQFF